MAKHAPVKCYLIDPYRHEITEVQWDPYDLAVGDRMIDCSISTTCVVAPRTRLLLDDWPQVPKPRFRCALHRKAGRPVFGYGGVLMGKALMFSESGKDVTLDLAFVKQHITFLDPKQEPSSAP